MSPIITHSKTDYLNQYKGFSRYLMNYQFLVIAVFSPLPFIFLFRLGGKNNHFIRFDLKTPYFLWVFFHG